MPVDYTIASRVPQMSGGGMDPINMLAQMQAMDYRQRQNALAEMQMAEYQRRLQAEQALRGLGGEAGFNIADPRLVGRAVQLGGLEEGVRIANLQRSLEQLKASEEAQRAQRDVAYGGLALKQKEYEEVTRPEAQLRREKLEFEKSTEGRKYMEAISKADISALDLAIKQTARAQDTLAGSTPETWAQDYDRIKQLDPQFAAKFKADKFPGQDLIDKTMQNADFVRQMAEERIKTQITPEFEYQQVQDAAGNTRVVAIPKRAPERGAITVPGAEGAKPADYGFMPGPPDTGFVTRTNPRTGEAELVTPRQPIMAPAEGKFDARANVMAPAAPANAMAAPAAPAPAAPAPARGALIPSEIRPTAEAPVGSAAYNNKRFATEVLDASGFNSETGEDRVSNLIRKSTSGGLQAKAAGIRSFFGRAPEGMEAIGEIKTIINDAILKKLNGKLGAGISNEDREFIKSTLGNLDDPDIPANQRLASWNSAKRILMKYANTGQPAIGAPAGRPSLDEIFK